MFSLSQSIRLVSQFVTFSAMKSHIKLWLPIFLLPVCAVVDSNNAEQNRLLEMDFELPGVRGRVQNDLNFTFGFSGNVSQATTINHNYAVVCSVLSRAATVFGELFTITSLDDIGRHEADSLENVPINLCTHILYFDSFLRWQFPNLDYSIDEDFEELADEEYELGTKLNRFKQRPGNTKLLLQIEDAIEENQRDSNLQLIAKNRGLRAKFINSTIQYLQTNNLDGLDILLVRLPTSLDEEDLRWRRSAMQFIPLLLFEIREAFKPFQFQLTLTFMQNLEIISGRQLQWIGFHRIVALVDHVHLLSRIASIYPLLDFELRGLNSPQTLGISLSLIETIKFIIEDSKLPPSKVVLGFYPDGHYRRLESAEQYGLAYPEICEAFRNNNSSTFFYSSTADVSLINFNGTTEWVSFESVTSITKKIELGLRKHIKGFMLHNIYNDDFYRGVCDDNGITFPLLRTMNSLLAQNDLPPYEGFSSNVLNSDRILKCEPGSNRNLRFGISTYGRNITMPVVMPLSCTHFSIYTTFTANQSSLQKLHLQIQSTTVLQQRRFSPNIKLTLSLRLYRADNITGKAYPSKNRNQLVETIINTLRNEQLDGIEITLITHDTPITSRQRFLWHILFHPEIKICGLTTHYRKCDLHKKLSQLGLTLGLTVEYVRTKKSNLLNDPVLFKHVDQINLLPNSGKISGRFRRSNSSIAVEAIKHLVNQGVPTSKIIVGMLNYGICSRIADTDEHSYYLYVRRSDVCSYTKRTPSKWNRRRKDGIEYFTNRNLTCSYETEEETRNIIRNCIDAGVQGFMVHDIFDAGSMCDEHDFSKRILETISQFTSPKLL